MLKETTHPVDMPTKEDIIAEKEINLHINYVIKTMPATDNRLNEIKEATMKDPILQFMVGQ